ncbi:MAG: hypothetical protein Q8L48_36450 [Archangium sp.]|nr:hypothetical protein [Archangium sp.]
MSPITAIKVFSATMVREREVLGERVTEWLKAHPELHLVDRVVSQSSDNEFHCLSITLFLDGKPDAYLANPPPSVPPRRAPPSAG